MRKLSIKFKITLYFTLVMFLLSALLMGYVVFISINSAKNDMTKTLHQRVGDLYNSISYKPVNSPHEGETQPPPENAPNDDRQPPPKDEGGKQPSSGRFPEMEMELVVPESFNYQSGSVSLYICEDGEGNAKYGKLFDGISFDASTAVNESLVKVKTEEAEYYVYARYLKRNDRKEAGGAWVVGAIDNKLINSMVYDTVKYVLVILPITIILAAVFGYIITRRAFRPVKEITDAAADIANGSDLSKRINLGEGKGEIYKLANTFDSMLETIQHNFEREKQFTNDASHELRTPVSIIMAHSELGLDSKASDADRKEALESINRQSHRVNKLLAELLSLARSDNEKTILEKESFDLAELTEMVIEEKKELAAERNIDIRLIGDKAVTVYADQTLIMRVLINLITNAVKYGKDGGFIEVSVHKNGEDGAVCRVKDNGIGISESDLLKIWDRFFRTDTARTFDENGSFGLGLPMVKSIIETHGGTVKASSVLGEGSTFEFTI